MSDQGGRASGRSGVSYEIVAEVAEARPIAAVRRRVHLGHVSTAWKPALDAFDGEDEVAFAHTPAGPVAWTLHVGPYDRLADAHGAIDAWRAAHGRAFAGASWEIYGDPGDDPAKLAIRVFYLLA